MRRFLRHLLLLVACPALLHAQIPGLTFTQVPIPTPRDVNPYSIAGGTGGRIWFADVTFKQVGFFGADNSITKFRLTDSANATNEVRPLSITEGPDGNGWFTGYITDSSGSPLERSFVGRVTPAGAVTMFPMPTGNACFQFFGLPACGITTGPDGNLWFAETEVQKVGRITTAGQITEFSLSSPGFVLHIASGSDGNLWLTDRVRSGGTIWRVTTQGAATEFKVPGGSPFMITKGPDGNVWFTVNAANSIGRITPTGTITTFPVPATSTPNAGLFGIATGPDGNLYFTEANDKQVGQLIPSTGAVAEAAVPNGEIPRQVVAVTTASVAKVGSQNGRAGIALNAVGADHNIYKATITAPLTPKLLVEKTVDIVRAGRKRLGDIATFTIVVRKESADDLFSVKLTDVLPPCVEFLFFFGDLQEDEACSFSAGVLTCTKQRLRGALDLRIQIIVRVKTRELCVNTATATAMTAEGTPVNADAQAVVPESLDSRDTGTQRIDPESEAQTSGRLFGPGKKP